MKIPTFKRLDIDYDNKCIDIVFMTENAVKVKRCNFNSIKRFRVLSNQELSNWYLQIWSLPDSMTNDLLLEIPSHLEIPEFIDMINKYSNVIDSINNLDISVKRYKDRIKV